MRRSGNARTAKEKPCSVTQGGETVLLATILIGCAIILTAVVLACIYNNDDDWRL